MQFSNLIDQNQTDFYLGYWKYQKSFRNDQDKGLWDNHNGHA